MNNIWPLTKGRINKIKRTNNQTKHNRVIKPWNILNTRKTMHNSFNNSNSISSNSSNRNNKRTIKRL